MSSKTTNYKLHKIDLADSPPDITVLNGNFDIIDAELKTRLPLDGSVPMTGYIIMNNTGDYFALQKDRITENATHRMTLGVAVNGATTIEHYKDSVVQARLEMHSMVSDPTNAIIIRENSGKTGYRLFGEHNIDLLRQYVSTDVQASLV